MSHYCLAEVEIAVRCDPVARVAGRAPAYGQGGW